MKDRTCHCFKLSPRTSREFSLRRKRPSAPCAFQPLTQEDLQRSVHSNSVFPVLHPAMRVPHRRDLALLAVAALVLLAASATAGSSIAVDSTADVQARPCWHRASACCVAAHGAPPPPGRAAPAPEQPSRIQPAGCRWAMPSSPNRTPLLHTPRNSPPADRCRGIVARACPARRLPGFGLASPFAAASAAKAVFPQAPPAAPPPALTYATPQPSATSIRHGCADLGVAPARHDHIRQLHFGGLPSNLVEPHPGCGSTDSLPADHSTSCG